MDQISHRSWRVQPRSKRCSYVEFEFDRKPLKFQRGEENAVTRDGRRPAWEQSMNSIPGSGRVPLRACTSRDRRVSYRPIDLPGAHMVAPPRFHLGKKRFLPQSVDVGCDQAHAAMWWIG